MNVVFNLMLYTKRTEKTTLSGKCFSVVRRLLTHVPRIIHRIISCFVKPNHAHWAEGRETLLTFCLNESWWHFSLGLLSLCLCLSCWLSACLSLSIYLNSPLSLSLPRFYLESSCLPICLYFSVFFSARLCLSLSLSDRNIQRNIDPTSSSSSA